MGTSKLGKGYRIDLLLLFKRSSILLTKNWPEDLFKAPVYVLTHEKRAPWVQIHEFSIHIAPILIGSGVRPFDLVDKSKVSVKITSAIHSPSATHINYTIVK